MGASYLYVSECKVGEASGGHMAGSATRNSSTVSLSSSVYSPSLFPSMGVTAAREVWALLCILREFVGLGSGAGVGPSGPPLDTPILRESDDGAVGFMLVIRRA